MRKKPLFVPLQKKYFMQFVDGTKRDEYRVNGPRWNKGTCTPGRQVVIANGYGWPRLRARIVTTTILPAQEAPLEARELFGEQELIRIHLTNIRPLPKIGV